MSSYGDEPESVSFKWISPSVVETNTNTKFYNKFEWNKQEISCFDVVFIETEDGNELGIGRIIKIYEKHNETPFISLKWFKRTNDNTQKIIFDDIVQEEIAITNIKCKVMVFDSEQMMDEYKLYNDVFPAFYCDEYWNLDIINRERKLFKMTNDSYNNVYWNIKRQNEAQKFDERRLSLTTVSTASNNSNSNSNQYTLSSSSSSEQTDSDSMNIGMVRNANGLRLNRIRNPRKRSRSQDDNDDNHNNLQLPPVKRRKISVSCKNCRNLLKTEIKLLTKSINDKDVVIHQKDSLFGHYDELIRQKDCVIDQKNEIIEQKNDIIDALQKQ